MRYSFTFALLLATMMLSAQTWTDLTLDTDQPGLERNPLKGFATMFNYGGAVDTFPHSIRGKLFQMNELMQGPGQFTWDTMDDFFAEQEVNGNHVFFQVNIDPANGTSWMPDFIKSQMGNDEWYYQENIEIDPLTLEEKVTFRDSIPNWNNQLLFDSMLELVDSMGLRYNGDARLFMAQIGLYGSWGEWNIPEEAVEAGFGHFQMSADKQLQLAARFEDAFDESYILARYPANMPDPQAYGYSDGLFFGQSFGEGQPFYFDNILKAANADDNWKLHPIGGEIRPEYQPYLWDQFPNQLSYPDMLEVPQDVYQALDSIRPTWLFSHHVIVNMLENPAGTTGPDPAVDPTYDPQKDKDNIVNMDEWENALRCQKAMGYTLYVDRYRLSAEDRYPTIEVNIKNIGLAPMYCNWELEFGYLDGANGVVPLGRTTWDLKLIQPDVEENYRSFVSPTQLPDAEGEYTLVMRIINPMETTSANAPTVTFANSSMDTAEAMGWLVLGEADLTAGALGQSPVAVTGVTLDRSAIDVPRGQVGSLVATILPVNATSQAITWVSTRPGSISVDETGVLTARGEVGEQSLIRAYTQDGALYAECLATIVVYVPTLPELIQAEDFVLAGDVNGSEDCSDVGGGKNIGDIHDGDWLQYDIIVEPSATEFELDLRVASGDAPPAGGWQIELRDEAGLAMTSFSIATAEQNWNAWETITIPAFSLPIGEYRMEIRMVSGRFNLNWFEFRSVSDCPADINGDGIVDIQDYLSFNSVYGSTCLSCPEDIDENGLVDITDFLLFNGAYGTDCSATTSMPVDEDQLLLNDLLIDEIEGAGHEMSAALQKDIDRLRDDIDMTVFPQPSDGRLVSIRLRGDVPASAPLAIQVHDLAGRMVYQESTVIQSTDATYEITFDRGLAPGTYVLSTQLNGRAVSEKLVVR